jgi:hypothetical protein
MGESAVSTPGENLQPKNDKRQRVSRRPPKLTVAQILEWADEHCEKTGHWPTQTSGEITATVGETWMCVDTALRTGTRGLEGNSSLAQLLAKHRGYSSRSKRPPLAEEEILAWADSHRQRTGNWPTQKSGRIAGSVDETWGGVSEALRTGTRGLAGDSSLARLLAQHRGYSYKTEFPPLTEKDVLDWADAHRQRTGNWPTSRSGKVLGVVDENWSNINHVLRVGLRGLPGGSSLARLLAEKRGVRNPGNLPCLRVEQILSWADAHHQRTGEWPTISSGPIPEAPGETWQRVQAALCGGCRRQAGGSSLARLLIEKRGMQRVSPLTIPQILAWADHHHQLTGCWPRLTSGPIRDAAGETWLAVDAALKKGLRTLPGGSSLARLLATERGARNGRDG